MVTTSNEGVGQLVIGGEGEGGDVEVVIDGDIKGPIQVSHHYIISSIFSRTIFNCR